jgi:hypothetical protein
MPFSLLRKPGLRGDSVYTRFLPVWPPAWSWSGIGSRRQRQPANQTSFWCPERFPGVKAPFDASLDSEPKTVLFEDRRLYSPGQEMHFCLGPGFGQGFFLGARKAKCERTWRITLLMASHPFHLILDLNVTCDQCQYSIPPSEMIVVSPGRLKCPKCQSVFVGQRGQPIDTQVLQNKPSQSA